MTFSEKETFLVTGASGFVGANMARRLVLSGYPHVHALVRKTSDLWRLKGLDGKLIRHNCDLSHKKELTAVIKDIKPSVVFHCATYGGYSYQSEREQMVRANVEGTINLFAALDISGGSTIINVGSSSEYGILNRPMKESDRLKPVDYYGFTKAVQTRFAENFAYVTGMPVTTVRIFSAFGPYEDKKRLIPHLVRSAIDGATVLIKSPGSVRDYIYIDDVVDFMISAASKRKSLGILNLGAGECRSVIDVVDVINGITGRELDIKISTEEYLRPEPDPWVSDMSRSKRILKWKAGNTFGEGMKKTIEWEKRTGAWKS